MTIDKPYVEFRDGGFWLADCRVSLDSVILAFLEGRSPEAIADSFPLADLEKIYGAISFYLSRREAIDRYLATSEDEFEHFRDEARRKNPHLYQKLESAG